MRILKLTEENIASYAIFAGEDIAENIGRKNYRGLIAVEEDFFLAGIIWQYIYTDGECESSIEWFKVFEPSVAGLLFSAYKQQIDLEKVKQSTLIIPALKSKKEKELLKEAGFNVRINESDKIIVTLSELSAMPFMNSRKIPKQIKPIGDISVRQFKKGISRCVSIGKRGLCNDLEYLPVPVFEPNVSVCYLDSEDEVSGFLLFHMLPSGMLSLQLMISLEKEAGAVIMGMMRLFVIKMEENYAPDTKILLDRHNESSLKLSEKLLPRGFGIPENKEKREES